MIQTSRHGPITGGHLPYANYLIKNVFPKKERYCEGAMDKQPVRIIGYKSRCWTLGNYFNLDHHSLLLCSRISINVNKAIFKQEYADN